MRLAAIGDNYLDARFGHSAGKLVARHGLCLGTYCAWHRVFPIDRLAPATAFSMEELVCKVEKAEIIRHKMARRLWCTDIADCHSIHHSCIEHFGTYNTWWRAW